MNTVDFIRQRAASNVKKIALPEYNDKRVSEAAAIIAKEKIAEVVLLSPDRIDAKTKERYIGEYFEMRKSKGVELEAVRKQFEDPLWYAAMMTREGLVDGFVAGAAHTTADVARSSIHCLGLDERFMVASSCFIMIVPDASLGQNGTFIFADCGILPNPSSRQLACIAVQSAELAEKVLGIPSRVALLSYSTKGSASGRDIDRVVEGVRLAKELAPNLIIDGELQVDAAIVPEVAEIKYPNSSVGGKANVLIFPSLEAGNIAYKLTQRLANARALGPLIMGLNKPCSDLSRGCIVEDVIDCVAVTAIRMQ